MYVFLVAAVLAAGLLFQHYAGRVNYAPLFTNMDARQAAGVVDKLKEMNVKYQLADQGSTVMVPREQVYDLRLQMAGSGMLVGSGIGFEIFDQTKLGVTDFERRMNYLRAMQEELRRTIVQMDEVEQARVHLVLPEPSVFVREQRAGSASVTLKLKPMARLKPEQVRAIIYLVASGVENLPPENVKVIDTQFGVLSDGVNVAEGSLTQQRVVQQDLKREFERDLERRIQEMLERILGPGKAVAMVTANLDFNHKEVTRIEFGDQVERSVQVMEETGSSTGGATQPAGIDPNLGYTYPVGGGGDSQFNKTTRSTTYEISQTQTKEIYAPGKLISLSTAVAVDGELDPAKVAVIENLVRAATGYNPNKKDPSLEPDQIIVTSMAFNNDYIKEAEQALADLGAAQRKAEQTRQWITFALQALGIILAFVLGLMMLRRRMESGRMVDITVPELIPVKQIATPALTQEDQMRKEKQDRVREMARQKPEEVAHLIRAWMAED